MEKPRIIAEIKKILAGIDDSLEDEDKLSMVRGYWDAGRLATEYKDSTGILPVHDAKAREFYLEQACRRGWNKYELTKRIQKDYYGAVEDAARANQSKTLRPKKQRLYTYAAEVIKIVDADTFDLEIDVGFKTKQEHRVRLRGINAPEIGTSAGRKAKRFVERELGKCVVEKPLFKGTRANRPLVVVKTYKLGRHGRYTVDIYYLPGEAAPEVIVENGKLLNQVLVDKGLARKVE